MMTRSPCHSLRRGLVALTVLAHIGVGGATALHAQQAGGAQAAGPVLQLSMTQAEEMALEANLQLRSDRLGPAIAAENLAAARSVFNPTVGSSLNRGSSQRAASSVFEAASASVTTSNLSFGTSLSQQLPWYGGSYQVRWNSGRGETSQLGATFNPTLSSGLFFIFTQPLLSGFRVDGQRQQVQTALRNRSIADVQLDERIVATRVTVQNAYLDLIGANARRDVAQQNLDLTRRTLRDNQSRVEVGTMAPISIIEAEAEVARGEEAVILAEASIAAAEDRLRALILDPSRPDYWEVRLEPTDTITLQPREVNLDAAILAARQNRTDLIVARSQMDITDLNLTVLRDSTLPAVNLQFNYSASGTGGTRNIYDNSAFPPQLLRSVDRGFGAVVGDSFKNNLPTWSLGLNVSYPLGKSNTEASLARQRIQRQQQETSLRNLELQVTTAVRAAARDVQTNFKRVEVTQIARQRAERQLEAEEKKFSVGLSSTFELQQRQRDLATARISELQATIDYNRSLIAFEAIQKAPVR